MVVLAYKTSKQEPTSTLNGVVVQRQEEDFKPTENMKEKFEQHEPIQELPGDSPSAVQVSPRSPMGNRLLELDSLRPLSELTSDDVSRERWSAMHATQATSPNLPDVAEIGDGRPSPPPKEDALAVGYGDDPPASSIDNDGTAGRRTVEKLSPTT
jgi:hypothetical protein